MGKLKAGPLLRTPAKKVVTLPAASTVRIPTRVPRCRVGEGLLPALLGGLVSARLGVGRDIDEAALKASVACCPCAIVCLYCKCPVPTLRGLSFRRSVSFPGGRALARSRQVPRRGAEGLEARRFAPDIHPESSGSCSTAVGIEMEGDMPGTYIAASLGCWIEALRQRFDVLECGTRD